MPVITSVSVRLAMKAFHDARRNSSSSGSTPGHSPWYAAVRQWSLAASRRCVRGGLASEQGQHLAERRAAQVVGRWRGEARVTRMVVVHTHERLSAGEAALHPHRRHGGPQHRRTHDAVGAGPGDTVGQVRRLRRAAQAVRRGMHDGVTRLGGHTLDLPHLRVLRAQHEHGIAVDHASSCAVGATASCG